MVYICSIKCSLFCLFVSIWGAIQLVLMGVFHSMHSLAFAPYLPLNEHYDSLKEFRQESDKAYSQVAMRCYASGALYGLFAITALICIRLKKRQIMNRRNLSIRLNSQVL